jgi:hypothetical protein
MALSNWDLLAIGSNSKSCDGSIKNDNIEFEIYKNWLYAKIKTEDDPHIISIEEGRLSIGNASVYAIRDELQNSIFVFITISYQNKEKIVYKYKYLAGIGCYGCYDKIKEYLKYKNLDITYKDCWISSRNYKLDGNGGTIPLNEFIESIIFEKSDGTSLEVDVDKEFGELTEFVGVMPETFKAFRKWIEIDIKEEKKYNKNFNKWLDKIDWDNLSRFNQGDAFFIGGEKAQTLVGEQNKNTILGDIIDDQLK